MPPALSKKGEELFKKIEMAPLNPWIQFDLIIYLFPALSFNYLQLSKLVMTSFQ